MWGAAAAPSAAASVMRSCAHACSTPLTCHMGHALSQAIVHAVTEGYSGSIIAYGQTGARRWMSE